MLVRTVLILNPWSFFVQKITDVIQIQQIMIVRIYLHSVGRKVCFHITVVDKFKYLGSYLTRNCRDEFDADFRIASVNSAFGALRKCNFSSYNILTLAKRSVYISTILSILLYGSKCWILLTKKLLSKLRIYHNQCIRNMCRVTLKHTWYHSISAADLQKRIGLHPIDYYIFSRRLCWIGRVSRINFDMLPRHMLSYWVPNKRPVGRPRLTHGETVNKALKSYGFDKDKVHVLPAMI